MTSQFGSNLTSISHSVWTKKLKYQLTIKTKQKLFQVNSRTNGVHVAQRTPNASSLLKRSRHVRHTDCRHRAGGLQHVNQPKRIPNASVNKNSLAQWRVDVEWGPTRRLASRYIQPHAPSINSHTYTDIHFTPCPRNSYLSHRTHAKKDHTHIEWSPAC